MIVREPLFHRDVAVVSLIMSTIVKLRFFLTAVTEADIFAVR